MTPLDAIVALGIGVAFGIALERAGLGNARKLSGQFLLRDFTVVKVMFSAIVTAMLGLYWLGRIGAIDPAFLYVPETHLAPQMAGGALFGFGFAFAGLCPGTSCVSAATGRGDGFAAVAGLFGGVLVTGLFFAPLQSFYESGGRGALTLPSLLHLPAGVVALFVVLAALGAFLAAAKLEPQVPGDARRLRGAPRLLAAAALGLGVLAAIDGVRTEAPKPSASAPLVRPHSGC